MRTSLPLLLLVLALAGAVVLFWWPWSSPVADGAGQERTGTSTGRSERLAGDAATVSAGGEPVSGSRREVTAEGAGEPAPSAGTVVIRGRCIDAETRRPIAGCKAELQGSPNGIGLVDLHVRKHGAVVWQDPEPRVSGQDGSFEFRIVPPPPYQFVVQVTGRGLVPMRAFLVSRMLEAKAQYDLGDLEMQSGAELRGGVVDADGNPQPNTTVRLSRTFEFVPRKPYATSHLKLVSSSGGVLGLPEGELLAPGRWHLGVRDREGVEPKTFEVRKGQAIVDLTVTVATDQRDHMISGVVVDDRGRPVPEVQIDHQLNVGVTHYATTDAAGSFVIRRKRGAPATPVKLSFWCQAHERLSPQDPVEWGSSGLRFVLRVGLTVNLRVQDGKSGEPVEEFGVCCFRDPRQVQHWENRNVRLRGRHPGGLLAIPGILRGRNLLVVEPTDPGYCVSSLVAFDVAEDRPVALTVDVSPACPRRVRVVRRDGSPVQGSSVELFKALEGVPSIDTKVQRFVGNAFSLGHDSEGLLLEQATTTAAGMVEVVGPRTEQAALRVTGQGHRPVVVPAVSFQPGLEPLEVVVSSGATLRAQVRPLAVLEQFQLNPEGRAQFDSRPEKERQKQLRANRPALKLVPVTKGPAILTWRDKAIEAPFEADGKLEIRGIPPGSWECHLCYSRGTRNSMMRSSFPLGVVCQLQEDEVEEVDLEIGRLRFAALTGLVFLDGEPAPKASVYVASSRPGYPGLNTVTDAEGRFRVSLVPSKYSIRVFVRGIGLPGYSRLGALEEVELSPGGVHEQKFLIRTGSCSVRLLASDGKSPLADVAVMMRWRQRESVIVTVRSDANGVLTNPKCTMGEHDLYLWKTRYRTAQAQVQAHREGLTWEDMTVPIGRVEAGSDKKATRKDIVVPVESGY